MFIDMKTGEVLQHVDYLEYQTELPFQADLFVPPADIQLSEAE
jgi:hypothetical protein